jgi:hypothetical protein
LIQRDKNQSQCIRLGIELEKLLEDYILQNTEEWCVLPKKVGNRTCDHLFLNKTKQKIIYAEIKCNLNLDTEKSMATIQKCKAIEKQLLDDYHCPVQMFLVCLRYYKKDLFPPIIINKYQMIHENVCGVNEYLKTFGLECFEKEEEYKGFLEEFVTVLFGNKLD